MTKQEFIDLYCKNSEMDWAELGVFLEPVPCECGETICQGWAMLEKNEPEEGQPA